MLQAQRQSTGFLLNPTSNELSGKLSQRNSSRFPPSPAISITPCPQQLVAQDQVLLQKRLRTNNGFLKTQGFSSKENYIFTSCPKFQVKIINFCSNPSSKSNVMKKPSAKMMMEKEHRVFCRSDSTNPRELSPRQKERIKNVAETFPQGYRKSTVGSWKSQSGCAWKAPLEVICSNPSAQGNPREQPAQKTWASLPHQKPPALPSDPSCLPAHLR